MRRIATAALSILLAFSMLLMVGGTASANALAGGGYSSSYSGESVFTNVAAGGSGQFSAIFFNDGTQAWAPGVVGLLVCLPDKVTCNVASPNAAYASGWTSSTVYATVTATVAPGQNGFFIYNFTVPAGTAGGTAATFNGDVGLIATGAELRPEGYYQVNTTPSASVSGLTISPTSASLPVGGQQQFTVTGAPAGSTVTWNVTGGCGAITNTGLFAATASNSSTQPCAVTATAGGSTATASIIVFGPGSALVCKSSPASVPADNGSKTITVTASLVDASGNMVTNNSTDSIAYTNNTPSIVTTSSITPSPRTMQNGVATALAYSTFTAGTGVISFTDSTTTSITGCTATVTTTTPGNPVQLGTGYNVASAYLSTIDADGTSTSVLEFDVLDANGALVGSDSTDQISIQRTSGASVCSPGSAGPTTVSSGAAYFTITSTTTPGTCTYAATANNVAITGSASATVTTVIAGSPNRLVVASAKTPQAADGVTTLRITVALQDASGNPITNTAVTGGTTPSETITGSLGSNCSGTNAAGNADQVWFLASGAVLNSTTPNPAAIYGTSTTSPASGWSPRAATRALKPGSFTLGGTSNYARFLLVSTFGTTCTVTFTSSDTNVSSASANITFNAQGATTLACNFSPNTLEGSTYVGTIVNDGASVAVGTVDTVDPFNNLASTNGISVSFSRAGTANTTLLTASPQTTSNGTVQFSVRSSTVAAAATDTYTATATIAGTSNSKTCLLEVYPKGGTP